MSRHLRLDLYTLWESGVKDHAQTVMKELGIEYQHATPQSMGDQWWFWNCENVPSILPPFLSDLDVDPMNVIRYGLSEEGAKRIRDWKPGDERF